MALWKDSWFRIMVACTAVVSSLVNSSLVAGAEIARMITVAQVVFQSQHLWRNDNRQRNEFET